MYNFLKENTLNEDLFKRCFYASYNEAAAVVGESYLNQYKKDLGIVGDSGLLEKIWKDIMVGEVKDVEDSFYATTFPDGGQDIGYGTGYKDGNTLVFRSGLFLPLNGTRRWVLDPQYWVDKLQWAKDEFDCTSVVYKPDNSGTFWAGLKQATPEIEARSMSVTLTEEDFVNGYSGGWYASFFITEA